LRAVGLPVFNEEANLAELLQFLVDENDIDEIVAVDDCSTDGSLEILKRFAIDYDQVRVFQATERSGQLAAWRRAASESRADAICFIDADAIPARGACSILFDALEGDPNLVAASGRTMPDADSRVWPAARFRADLVHRLRALQLPRHTIIGRFFAVRRGWFLETALRSDIIANDAYLGGAAARSGRTSKYVPSAICYYGEAQTTFDFAAQRQRADAGYAQLRDLGIVYPEDAPRFADYVRVIAAAAASDPAAAAAWASEQMKARGLRAYRASGKDAGGWEVQASTKRRLGVPPEKGR
jgi:cellulose synthase/poly-beta-1,6-N-acetylglucosamine synthase-like glycosyltransferase